MSEQEIKVIELLQQILQVLKDMYAFDTDGGSCFSSDDDCEGEEPCEFLTK